MVSERKSMQFDLEEDVRGARCPLPMLRAKRALSQLDVGQIALVISTDKNSYDDFVLMLKHVDHELVKHEELPCQLDQFDTEFHFYIRKG
jgi:tRNA 2-thiouridine synthesizing protein A